MLAAMRRASTQSQLTVCLAVGRVGSVQEGTVPLVIDLVRIVVHGLGFFGACPPAVLHHIRSL